MKKYPLSTPAERTAGIVFSVFFIAVLGFLLYVLRNNLTIFLLAAIGVLLISVILILYIMNVTKAAIICDRAAKKITVQGFREWSFDLEQVTCLQTITVKSGHVESRSLAFSNAEGAVVAIVPTYFTSNQHRNIDLLAVSIAICTANLISGNSYVVRLEICWLNNYLNAV